MWRKDEGPCICHNCNTRTLKWARTCKSPCGLPSCSSGSSSAHHTQRTHAHQCKHCSLQGFTTPHLQLAAQAEITAQCSLQGGKPAACWGRGSQCASSTWMLGGGGEGEARISRRCPIRLLHTHMFRHHSPPPAPLLLHAHLQFTTCLLSTCCQQHTPPSLCSHLVQSPALLPPCALRRARQAPCSLPGYSKTAGTAAQLPAHPLWSCLTAAPLRTAGQRGGEHTHSICQVVATKERERQKVGRVSGCVSHHFTPHRVAHA
jgi:hypothetical protein